MFLLQCEEDQALYISGFARAMIAVFRTFHTIFNLHNFVHFFYDENFINSTKLK